MKHQWLAELIQLVIRQTHVELDAGAAVSATSESVRVHRLPIGRTNGAHGGGDQSS